MRRVLTAALLALRFLLELGLLAAAAWIGWSLGDGGVPGALIGAALAVATAALWGAVLSPKARAGLPLGQRLAVESGLFTAAALGLWATGQDTWAIVLISGEGVVLASLLALGHRPGPAAQ